MNFILSLFSFNGRMNRVQYATIFLVGYIAPFFTLMVTFEITKGYDDGAFLFLSIIVILMWILFAAMAKRFHDIGKSGWMCLSILVPIIGQFVPFVLLFYPGDSLENEFGSPPIYFA